jgi:hypothetical protein
VKKVRGWFVKGLFLQVLIIPTVLGDISSPKIEDLWRIEMNKSRLGVSVRFLLILGV